MTRLWIKTDESGGGAITLNAQGIITAQSPVWLRYYGKHVTALFKGIRSHTNLEVRSL